MDSKFVKEALEQIQTPNTSANIIFRTYLSNLKKFQSDLLLSDYQTDKVLATVDVALKFNALIRTLGDLTTQSFLMTDSDITEWFKCLGFAPAKYQTLKTKRKLLGIIPFVYKSKGACATLESVLRYTLLSENVTVYERVITSDKKIRCYKDGKILENYLVEDINILDNDPYWWLLLDEIKEPYPHFLPYITITRNVNILSSLSKPTVTTEFDIRSSLYLYFNRNRALERIYKIEGIPTYVSLVEIYLFLVVLGAKLHSLLRSWYPQYYSTPFSDLTSLVPTNNSQRVLAINENDEEVTISSIRKTLVDYYEFESTLLLGALTTYISENWDNWNNLTITSCYNWLRSEWEAYDTSKDAMLWELARLIVENKDNLRNQILWYEAISLLQPTQTIVTPFTHYNFYHNYLPRYYNKCSHTVGAYITKLMQSTHFSFTTAEEFYRSLLRYFNQDLEMLAIRIHEGLSSAAPAERVSYLAQLFTWLYDVMSTLSSELCSTLLVPQSSVSPMLDFMKPHYVRTLEGTVVKTFEINNDNVFLVDSETVTQTEEFDLWCGLVVSHYRYLAAPLTLTRITREELYNLDQVWTALNEGYTLDEDSFILFRHFCGKTFALKPPRPHYQVYNAAWDIKHEEYALITQLPKIEDRREYVILKPTFCQEAMTFALQKIYVPEDIKNEVLPQVGYLRVGSQNIRIKETVPPNTPKSPTNERTRLRSFDWWSIQTLQNLLSGTKEYYARYGDDMVIIQSYKDDEPEYNYLITQN